MAAETETPENVRGGRPDMISATGPRAWLLGGRGVWILLAVAACASALPAKLLLDLFVFRAFSGLPSIVPFILCVLVCVALIVIWGLTAIAVFRGRTARLVVLVLLLLPIPFEVAHVVDATVEGIKNRPPTVEEQRSGRAWFDTRPDQDLAAAIWACGYNGRSRGAVCDLDKVRTLAPTTDTARPGPRGMSNMELALTETLAPDGLRLVLRGGKPPQDLADRALWKAYQVFPPDLPLLHALLDGGVDPNTRNQAGRPYVFLSIDRSTSIEGLAAFLDAGARIDDPDEDGYTLLMKSILFGALDQTELLLARGASEDHVAPDGTTLDSLIARLPPETRQTPRAAVRALIARHQKK